MFRSHHAIGATYSARGLCRRSIREEVFRDDPQAIRGRRPLDGPGRLLHTCFRRRPGQAAAPTFGFSTLKTATPEAAKAKAEAWLKSVGKFDQAAFNKIWADETRTVLDRTADSLALGNPEASRILANVRKFDAPAPAELRPS